MIQHLTARILIHAVLIFSMCTSAFAQTEDGDDKFKDEKLLKEFDYKDNIVYKTVDGQQLEMTVFMPKTKRFKKTPVMLFTHGGGWSGGNRYVILKKNFISPMKSFLDSGIACVSIEYRLTKGKSTAVDAVTDCKDGGRYLVKHAADFGFDTSKMGVWGGSAGGHLSLMTGLTDPDAFPGDPALSGAQAKYKCIVSYYPQTTLTNKEVVNGTRYFTADKLNKMLGPGLGLDSEVARKLSPAEYIHKNNPPVLLLHGTADSILSYKNVEYYISQSKQKGSNAELITVVNGGHGFSGKAVTPGPAEISKRVADFIVNKLLH